MGAEPTRRHRREVRLARKSGVGRNLREATPKRPMGHINQRHEPIHVGAVRDETVEDDDLVCRIDRNLRISAEKPAPAAPPQAPAPLPPARVQPPPMQTFTNASPAGNLQKR